MVPSYHASSRCKTSDTDTERRRFGSLGRQTLEGRDSLLESSDDVAGHDDGIMAGSRMDANVIVLEWGKRSVCI